MLSMTQIFGRLETVKCRDNLTEDIDFFGEMYWFEVNVETKVSPYKYIEKLPRHQYLWN